MNSKKQITEERTTALLEASIPFERKKRTGLGPQYGSEPKGLGACESFLREASKSLDGTKQTSLKARIELLITEVLAEKAGAQDRFNDNV